MKNILFMLCLAFMAISCNPRKETKLPETEKQDSKTFSNEDQLKVVGDINFFITKKDFEAKKEIFLEQSDNKSTTGLGYIFGKYEFLRVDGSFVNDSLIYVSLVGLIYKDSFTPRFETQYNYLYSMIQQRYGDPTEKQKLPDEYELIRDKSKICDLWIIGDKYVIIKALYEYGSYFLNLDIVRMDIVGRENKKILINDNQAVKDAASQI